MTKTSFLENSYVRLSKIFNIKVIIFIITVASLSYVYQYNQVTPSQKSFYFFAEFLKPIFAVIIGINAIYKYKVSRIKSWLLLFISCILWFFAQSIDLFSQLSPSFRDSVIEYKDYIYAPIFPFVIIGIIGIGLNSYSALSKFRIIFDGLTLAGSLSFFACSIFVLSDSSNTLIKEHSFNIYVDLTVASLAFSIAMFRGLDKVILPISQALFFNSIADTFRGLFTIRHEAITHPIVETLTIIAIVGYTYAFQTKEPLPKTLLTSKGEDILKYSIFAGAFACLIYAGVLYSTKPNTPSMLWLIFALMVGAMLGTQILTHYENRNLLTQREKDLSAMTTSEEKFRIAFENGPTTLVLLDEEGKVLRANKAFYNFTEFDEGDVLGSALSYIIHPDDRAIFDVNLATVLAHLSGDSMNVECRFLQKDGTIRWGSASVSHIPLSFMNEEDAAEFVVQIEDITDQKVHETELKTLAIKDPLTGLWNRTHFFELINEIIDRKNLDTKEDNEANRTFAVMFLDLDRFKIINDTLGHAAGDVVLHITAERITSIVGTRGEVARIGGDEFVILLSPPVTETVANLIAQEIKETLCQPILLSQGETIITCSIGVVMCSGTNLNAQDILREADSAMYRAKEHGKNSIEMSSAKDRQRISTELKFSNDLHRALNTQQIIVYYQPIVALQTNEIVGFEALSRWMHPKKGLISPDEFIPLAEDTGLILNIGYYVMEQAFSQLGKWQKIYSTSSGRPLTMNVNLSVTQLRDPKLLREIERVRNQSDALSHSMIFEITESAVLGDTKRAISLLNDITDLGFRLRVDDFGTGYSSLSYLKKLPIDGFKIDKSFINGLGIDEDDTAIVNALLGLAHAMHLTVTAEGIEQDSQRISLKELGCDYGQGYLFSEAMKAEDIVLPNRIGKNTTKNKKPA
ncbi:MAG: EAL domain-containing protein [Acidimicrobiia bacterium]